MDSKTTGTDGQDPVSNSQTKQSKNQNTDKTEPAHQPGGTKNSETSAGQNSETSAGLRQNLTRMHRHASDH